MIARRRTQMHRKPLDRLQRDFDQPDERLQPIDRLRSHVIAADGPDGASKIELDRGERLTEFVVELAGDFDALVFASGFDTGGQLSQLFLRLAQMRLLFLAAADLRARSHVTGEFTVVRHSRCTVPEDPSMLTVGATQPE